MNLDNLNVVELDVQEVQEVAGGRSWWPHITGILDGIPHNTHGYLLGYELW